MKKLNYLLFVSLFLAGITVQAQDGMEEQTPGLSISGSVDTYFKYDFSGEGNIGTSFADEQNSLSIGMVNVVLSQEWDKVSFVGDLSFGPRGQSASIPSSPIDGSFHIQNLYISYALSDAFSLTAGYMGTFVGYEVISPVGNFNYSTSYLFTNGPFQNAGIKLDWAISDRFGLMVGLFNDWNVYQDTNGLSDFGAQLYVMPVDGWDVYVNFVTGWPSGTEIDLTTGFQITDGFYLGLNAATYSAPDIDDGTNEIDQGGFFGAAIYPQVAFSDAVSVGLRAEYFAFKDMDDPDTPSVTIEGENVFAITLSANLKSGPFTFIPEFRFDNSSSDFAFVDGDGMSTSSAAQFLLAAVYGF